MMTQAEFHNALRLLRFVEPEKINPDNLAAAAAFEANPYNFFIRCDQPTRDRIWAAMELDNKPTPVAEKWDAERPMRVDGSAR